MSPDAQALITDILTHDPKKRPTLHQIIEHDFFTKGVFPPSIPTSAHEYPPNFSTITRQQSRTNYVRVRRAVLLDAEDTDIGTVDVVDSGSQLDAATAQQQQKQEREFHKAVQPGSPISVLLRSAREPLLVSKSPLRASHHASENRPPPPPVPTNALLRKLSAAAPKGSSVAVSAAAASIPFPPPPTLDEELDTATEKKYSSVRGKGAPPLPKDSMGPPAAVRQPLQSLSRLQEEQNEARRLYDLASQKARIVTQMAGAGSEGEDGARQPRGAGQGSERQQRERKEREPVVPVGKGLAEDETESIKPIRDTPRKAKAGKQKASASVHGESLPRGLPYPHLQPADAAAWSGTQHEGAGARAGAAKLQGYEQFAQTLNAACTAIDKKERWRCSGQSLPYPSATERHEAYLILDR